MTAEPTPPAADASLTPDYFDAVYAAGADPWQFETSAYEAAKYADTLSALGDRHFRRGFEIGCSIGVLTLQLAAHCDRLLAVDVSDAALAQARQRIGDDRRVELRRLRFPDQGVEGRFDLVVMSEVGYYWSRTDLDTALDRVEAALEPGGLLLMVHWTPPVHDYPLRGDQVHDIAIARTAAGALAHVDGWRRENYRLDLLMRR